MAKKVYIGVSNIEKRTLPSGYTQIEYIQTSGTQYIDTGFKPNQNTTFVVDVKITNTSCHIFGARNSFQNKAFCMLWASNSAYCVQVANSNFNGGTYSTGDRHTVTMTASSLQIDGSTTATYSVSSFQCEQTAWLMSCYSSSSSEYAQGNLYSAKIYDNGTLIRDFVPCKNSGGTIGVYDLVNSVFYTNAGTGTFSAGGEAKSTARLCKKMYFGVSSKARKVKKGYIGIGGVARPFFGGGELAYYGTITALSQARGHLAATNVGNYALFGGGVVMASSINNYTESSTVDAYNLSLTRSTPTALSQARHYLAATNVGNYALFGGGFAQSSNTRYATVDAYNASLTRSTPTVLSTARYDFAATNVGNYALFGGGKSTMGTNKVDAYNTSLTRSAPTSLSTSRSALAATNVGDYALFGGGDGGSTGWLDKVDAYNTSLTRSAPTVLSLGRRELAATNVGDYALFAGGNNDSTRRDTVDTYNTSLTKGTATGLSLGRALLTATNVGDYALFGGGDKYGTEYLNNVDAYHKSLTRTAPTQMSTAKVNLAVATIGDYALFGGGFNSGSGTNKGATSAVDAYTVA